MLLWGIFLVSGSPAFAEEAHDKGRLKAAMIYNIMRFVNLPEAQSTLTVCVRRDDAVAGDILQLDQRAIGSSVINVALVSGFAFSSSCDVIYLDAHSPRSITPRSRGQVLIGASAKFAERGGTVEFLRFGGQLRFIVNQRAASRSGVRFSSQLLQLAAKVIT